MGMPKFIIKVETEQGLELITLSIPADILGSWIIEQGQQLKALVEHGATPVKVKEA